MLRHSCLAFISLFVAPFAALASLSTVEEISQCVRDNLPSKNSTQTIVLRSINRVGDVTESNAAIYWQQDDNGLSKVLLRFIKPHDMRDSGVLMLEQEGRSPDTFLYLPSTKIVRRVSSRAASSSLFGTDFSYEDFARLVGMADDSSKERAEDAEVGGRPTYVVNAVPSSESGSSYEKVVTFVDQETCVPLRVESYEEGGRLRKRLTADAATLTKEGASWVSHRQTMEDLRDETRTEVEIEEIDTEANIHRKMFSARELESGAN
jgi:hypothetical protein